MGKCLEFGHDMTPKHVLSNETLSDIREMVINKPRSLRFKRELFIEPPKLGTKYFIKFPRISFTVPTIGHIQPALSPDVLVINKNNDCCEKKAICLF